MDFDFLNCDAVANAATEAENAALAVVMTGFWTAHWPHKFAALRDRLERVRPMRRRTRGTMRKERGPK